MQMKINLKPYLFGIYRQFLFQISMDSLNELKFSEI